MIEVVKFSDIVKIIKADERRLTGRRYCFDSVDSVTSNLMVEMNAKLKRHSLVAVIFCNPNSKFCKDEMLESLNYFHKRSKDYIHIFCCGYGAFKESTDYNDIQQVANIDGTPWFYSDTSFVDVVDSFEEKTKWTYSGENELLILDVTPSAEPDDITINNSIVCNLEEMKKDSAFTSVRSLMEKLIKYAASDECANAWEFSDKQGLSAAKDCLKDGVLGFLPKSVSALYKKSEGYAVRKI
jgi:hypothetical protein